MSTFAPPGNPYPAAPAAAAPDEPLLLWNRLVLARELVAEQRHQALTRSGTEARGDLLAALEAYVGSLVSRGRPVPYALRDELRLQRLTCPTVRR